MAPAGQVYEPGANRFGFGVFTVAGEQITDAEIAIYAAPGDGGQARRPLSGEDREPRDRRRIRGSHHRR